MEGYLRRLSTYSALKMSLQNARGKKGKDTQLSVEYAKAEFPNFCYLGCTSTVGMSEHHVQYLFFEKTHVFLQSTVASSISPNDSDIKVVQVLFSPWEPLCPHSGQS